MTRPDPARHPGAHGSPRGGPRDGTRRTSIARILLIIFVVLLLTAIIVQGATIHKIGFGSLSVEFGSATQPQGGGSGTTPTAPSAATGGDAADSGQKTLTGAWQGQRGRLTLLVTQVDNQGGHIRLHAKATNNSDAAMNLPLFGYFNASDNTGVTYQASIANSEWPASVGANGSVTGTIELQNTIPTSAANLAITFTVVFGQFAPQGGITVQGIKVPH